MNNIAVIFAFDLSSYAFKQAINNEDSFSRTVAFARGLPDISETLILANPGFECPEGCRLLAKESWTAEDLILTLRENCPSGGNVFFMRGDCPLLNMDIANRMYTDHCGFLAQYTFADGYPAGLAPEIINHEILDALQVLSAGDLAKVDRNTIYRIIEKDINAFDLETEIAPKDLRLYRVSLTADNKRNFMVLEAFIKEGAVEEGPIISAVTDKQELLRSIPAYFPIQIVGGCPQKCSFCPYPQINPGLLNDTSIMSADDFQIILDKIFSLAEDAIINLSLWGEPSLHPQIDQLVSKILNFPQFSLVMETSGIGWREDAFNKILALDNDRISWIVSLEASGPPAYAKLRGPGFEEAHAFVEKLLAAAPEKTYIQAVRMMENEEDLERFYRKWKDRTENLIIQKYDHFSGFLPERKVADLSPLVRMPCWHIKRDFCILLNGDSPMCREDLKNEYSLGNIFKDDIVKIWNKGQEMYKSHISGKYPGICGKCDEYYTYNF